ncbi:FAD-dependent oxidoreductase [Dehalobacterium formicoaceticum]|uniref:FAD-dependent oxidoreductase n=1 Tax=Dehalobacterium formicoaceticum TaxID=51515 RepID=A0ABT1Y8H5_9FIRM|nr:FAD-dependent oxidoreductase [Dehalobacterium formicoaceticum]MCR6546385.1 FAD-dependent oxidoreductase [Dehalobacterium formicoaceticum]
MSDEGFQVIIIGAGPAGSAAAYRLAKAGREVLLVDRGKTPGAKNMTGGRIYTHALEKLMPGKWADAPLEREITREIMMMMSKGDSFSIDSLFPSVSQSYSVLRAEFDEWLAAKVEEAGAMVISGSTVDGLLLRDGKVVGIKTGDEELEADLVISGEGVNPIVAERAGLIKPVNVKDIAVGVKYVYQLSEETINERFNTVSGKGAALLAVGECNKGIFGGAFIYTNKESISLGLVVDANSWKNSKISLADAAEELKQFPALARYIEGGKLIEYSAHLIPEGGCRALSELCADGFLLTGDAAGLCINRGFTVRGMDYAILSGIAAAEMANEAIDAGNYTKSFLNSYQNKLQQTVLKDFETLKNSHDYLAHTRHMFTTYPALATGLMKNLYDVDGNPAKSVMGLMKKTTSGKLSYFDVLKDIVKGGRSL